MPSNFISSSQLIADYCLVEKAIAYLNRRGLGQPNLRDLARHLKLSSSHLYRLFRRWAGVSPKQFTEFLSIQHAKWALKQARDRLFAVPSDTHGCDKKHRARDRMRDPSVSFDAVTPQDFRTMRNRLNIDFGIHPSPFGPCLIASAKQGICHLSFGTRLYPEQAIRELRHQWTNAHLKTNHARTKKLAQKIFSARKRNSLRLLLKGTHFQIKVWEALLRVPSGFAVSYGDIAASIGRPTATRAVASAVAANPVAYLVPCHRVIRKNGAMSGYRWNPLRKKAMLCWETCHSTKTQTTGVSF